MASLSSLKPLLAAAVLAGGIARMAAGQETEVLYEVSVGKYLMGTRVEATVHYSDIQASRAALVKAFQEMERVEHLLSMHIAESEISAINRGAGHGPVAVSQETFEIIQRAKGYSERLEGLFDVTIGPISRLWGFSSDEEVVVPDRERIEALLPLVGYQTIELNERDETVTLPREGMAIDLGGIAKGYAIDRAVAVLRENGIEHFLLNAGGDIFASGKKDGKFDWRVGVRHPRKANDLIAAFDVSNLAVATSGDYERFINVDGTRYHHILDPRTGYPGMLSRSATALAETAEEADVLATYFFLKGAVALQEDPSKPAFLVVDAAGKIHAGQEGFGSVYFEVWD